MCSAIVAAATRHEPVSLKTEIAASGDVDRRGTKEVRPPKNQRAAQVPAQLAVTEFMVERPVSPGPPERDTRIYIVMIG